MPEQGSWPQSRGMTAFFQIIVPVVALLGVVAFIGGGVLLPLFEIQEEREAKAQARKVAR